MKPKIILLFLSLTAFSFPSNAQLNKKYDKASFTVVPLSYSIKDTLAKDTSVNWSKLPYYSLLLSDVSSKHINAAFETSGKFFYNKTTIPENHNFFVQKKDTIAFENLFGKQMLKEGYPRQKFRNYQLPQYQKLPKHSTKNDSYGKWIQGQLESSSVPGEMMYLWTNENVLMSRSEDNIDHRDKSRGANSSSFNYYKKLLEKNYIVVQNSIVTQKYIVKPEILEATYKVMGYTADEINKSVGHMIEAFGLGTPPHGGIAIGVERSIMNLTNEKYLREVQAFPMTGGGQTSVMEAPSTITDAQQKELGIKVDVKK